MQISMFRCTGCLEDSHILDLSKRITSDEELSTLGVKGLGLPAFDIQSALYDNKRIQPAAYEVLSTWRTKAGKQKCWIPKPDLGFTEG